MAKNRHFVKVTRAREGLSGLVSSVGLCNADATARYSPAKSGSVLVRTVTVTPCPYANPSTPLARSLVG